MPSKHIPANNRSVEKEAVKETITGLFDAICRKDVKGIMSYYAPDMIAYDVKPPFQVKGAVAWKHNWEACIGYFPDEFGTEISDLRIYVNAGLAFAHYMFRLTGPETDHPAMQTWIRSTTGFKKQHSKWKIVHEHGSLPFHPHTLQAIFTLNPDDPLPENRMKPVDECRMQS